MIGNCATISGAIEASSLAAASTAVGPSPPSCAETIMKWMLCG
jgi:hypothetical protein